MSARGLIGTICVNLTSVLNECKVQFVGREKQIANVYATAHLHYETVEFTREEAALRTKVLHPTVSFLSNEEPAK